MSFKSIKFDSVVTDVKQLITNKNTCTTYKKTHEAK